MIVWGRLESKNASISAARHARIAVGSRSTAGDTNTINTTAVMASTSILSNQRFIARSLISLCHSQAHYCNTWEVTCSNQVDFNGSLSESAVIQPLPSTHIASADGRCRA